MGHHVTPMETSNLVKEKGTLKKFWTWILKEENTFFKIGIYLRGGCWIVLPTSPIDCKRMVASILLISYQTDSESVCIRIPNQINIILPSIWLPSYHYYYISPTSLCVGNWLPYPTQKKAMMPLNHILRKCTSRYKLHKS